MAQNDTGWIAPSGHAAGANWSNAANVRALDGAFAQCSFTAASQSSSLIVGYSTSLTNLPDSAIIRGIEYRVTRRGPLAATPAYSMIQNVRGGNNTGDPIAKANAWLSPASSEIYGGETDLWYTTWTAAQVKSNEARFTIQNGDGATDVFEVDCIEIRVHWDPDTTAPFITSATSLGVAEGQTLAHTLTADEAVTWNITGGADAAHFEIVGSTLRWASNGTRSFSEPQDTDANNVYVVAIRATDTTGNYTEETHIVGVQDVDWTFVGVSAAATAFGNNITLTEPAGAGSGDLLIAAISVRSTPTFTLPEGWTLIQQRNGGNTTANGTGSIGGGLLAYCIRGAAAPSYLFTRSGGDVAIGRVAAYRYDGLGVITPDVSSSNTLGTASTTVTAPSITTTAARTLIVSALFGARNISASAFDAATNPTTASGATNTTVRPQDGTWTERADSGTTTGADASLAIADAIRTTAGATGTVQATASTSARHSFAVAAFKIAAPSSEDPRRAFRQIYWIQ